MVGYALSHKGKAKDPDNRWNPEDGPDAYTNANVQPKLVEYSAAFRQSHPEEDKDPFKEPLDAELVMRLGGGKQHGSYWMANSAISLATTPTLREIRKAGSSSSSGIPIAPRRPSTYMQMEVSAVSFVVHSFHTSWLHIPCDCNIAGQVPGDDAGPPGGPGRGLQAAAGGPGRGPPAEPSGSGGALPASNSGPGWLRQVQVPGRGGASSLALCCTTTPSACSCSCSSEYIAFCFSLCGHPTGTNYITCPLCRLRRRVRTRLQVLALHWVFLHSTAGQRTRPTRRSRTRGLLLHRRRATPRGRGRRRSGGLARPTGTTTRRRGQGGLSRSHSHSHSQGGVRGSKVGALRPLGTAPRARYL